jgi:peptidoglycan/LPS O-acetylase OafA/YrhL
VNISSSEEKMPSSQVLPFGMEKHVTDEEIYSYIRPILVNIYTAITPSFLHRNIHGSRVKARLRSTAYLDGVRGYAALVVFVDHFVVDWFTRLRIGWGSSPQDYYFFQLPFVRLIHSGSTSIALFFAISGYVLSNKGIRLIHMGQDAALLNTLSSSLFRRSYRLYAPCVIGSFFAMLMAYAGWFVKDPENRNSIPPVFPTFPAQLYNWYYSVVTLINPFQVIEAGNHIYSPPYNGHFWTIPIELRGSIVVIGTLLAIAKLSPLWRILCVASLCWYTFWLATTWDLWLFYFGMLMAELDVQLRSPTGGPDMFSLHRPRWIPTRLAACITQVRNHFLFRLLIALLPYFLFLVSLHLMGYSTPDHINSSTAYGYKFLTDYTPDTYHSVYYGYKRLWCSVGAICLLVSLSLSPSTSPTPLPSSTLLSELVLQKLHSYSLQSLFTGAIPQYLGRISFSLYIVQGPILFTVGTSLMARAHTAYSAPFIAVGRVTESQGDIVAYSEYFALATVLCTAITIWAADVFQRNIDARVATSAKWIADKMG